MSFFFFFSSRRRHTRCLSDWSSDVCSSDLGAANAGVVARAGRLHVSGDESRSESYADILRRAGKTQIEGNGTGAANAARSEEHTSELQSLRHLVCRLLLEKKKQTNKEPWSY